jgi:hypothetical protein
MKDSQHVNGRIGVTRDLITGIDLIRLVAVESSQGCHFDRSETTR